MKDKTIWFKRVPPWAVRTALAALFVLAVQFGAWCGLILKSQRLPVPKSADAVVVFTGHPGRITRGFQLARETGSRHVFVTRTSRQELGYHAKRERFGGKTTGDFRARTTDGNARAAASFLREKGIKKAVLVTSWYHVPRAYLLSRLYLAGSGVKLRPVPVSPAPHRFFMEWDFWWEYLKGWGSLARVAAHALTGR